MKKLATILILMTSAISCTTLHKSMVCEIDATTWDSRYNGENCPVHVGKPVFHPVNDCYITGYSKNNKWYKVENQIGWSWKVKIGADTLNVGDTLFLRQEYITRY